MRSVYNAVNKWSNVEKVYVMWSEPNRYEVVHNTLDPSVKKDESVTYSRWDQDFDWNTFYGGHYYNDKHEYYVRHFQNERQNDIRTLERILFTQMYLEKNDIEYKMMCYKSIIIAHDKNYMTNGQKELYNKIDKLTSEELGSLKLKCQNSNDPVLISATSALGFEFLENKIYPAYYIQIFY